MSYEFLKKRECISGGDGRQPHGDESGEFGEPNSGDPLREAKRSEKKLQRQTKKETYLDIYEYIICIYYMYIYLLLMYKRTFKIVEDVFLTQASGFTRAFGTSRGEG